MHGRSPIIWIVDQGMESHKRQVSVQKKREKKTPNAPRLQPIFTMIPAMYKLITRPSPIVRPAQ